MGPVQRLVHACTSPEGARAAFHGETLLKDIPALGAHSHLQ